VGALKAAARPPQRIAFVTGKLAEQALREVLEELAGAAGFAYEVVVLNIAVAALMTAEWAARRLRLPAGVERAIFPGHCRGDLNLLANAAGVPVELGPKDLRELPLYFGRKLGPARDYGGHDLEIIAEVNHVPRLSRAEVLAAARRYRDAGADVVDLGCDPGGPFAGIGDCVKALCDEGFRVSVDSLEPGEIEPAVRAGAGLVLSANGSNVEALLDLDCEVVAIPDQPSSLAGLDRTIEKLAARGRRYRIDPVLEPIGFGFARSLERYLEARRRYPEAEMLMGVGNLTELTGADTAPVNVILLGFCAELDIRSVLTTEVAPWARSCVRELDIARRLVHYAVKKRRIPKHIEPRLHLLRDEAVLSFGKEKLAGLAREIRDRNFRIFAEDGAIHVINCELCLAGQNPFSLFEAMKVTDPAHAFYLGYEMAKAVTALTLGKNYVQDEALCWGFLTVEEEPPLEGKAGTGTG
jgi:dihydropteroate synthase-like protein